MTRRVLSDTPPPTPDPASLLLRFAKRAAPSGRLTINMNRKTVLQTAALIVAGIVLALVANAFASRDRKLALAGSYPNALTLPPRETLAPLAAVPRGIAAPATIATATAAIETVGLNPAAQNPAAPMTTRAAGGGPTHSQPATVITTTTTTAPTPHSPSPTPVTDDDPLKRFPPHPEKPYVEIAFADVKWLHGKNVLFLDARRTSVYELGHIAGARPYSVWESDIDDKVRKLFDERSDPREQALPIVIYCSGGDCEDSHMLAQKLWGIQFNDLYVYKDGFPDWQQHGGTAHTGGNP
ncbi:MAG: rhodanese-like domain-containing protein [Acidobacteriota bacterium]|nr:rhodanese-like domain-containing protein [Acidobacteriota bacterium]